MAADEVEPGHCRHGKAGRKPAGECIVIDAARPGALRVALAVETLRACLQWAATAASEDGLPASTYST